MAFKVCDNFSTAGCFFEKTAGDQSMRLFAKMYSFTSH